MSKKSLLVAVIIIVLLAAGGFAWWYVAHSELQSTEGNTAAPSSEIEGTILHVGTVIDENGAAADADEYKDFISYLARTLKDRGITGVVFVPVASVAEMAKLVRQGKVDMFIDSAFPVYAVNTLAESQVIAVRWKGGVEKYHAIVFAKKDGPIKTLDDLKGKIIGFDSLSSTAGFFLPKAFLTNKGYTLSEKATTTAAVSPSEIGYAFVHGDVFKDVADGTTPAGAESELEARSYFGPAFDSQYRILFTTPDVPRFLVTVRKGLDGALMDALKQTLFTMDTTADGRAVLASFAGTAKFTPSGTSSPYGDIGNLTELVEAEIIRGD